MTSLPALVPSAPAVFSFDSTFTLRVVTIDGEPWFVLRDLLAAMATRTTTTAAIESIAQGLGDGFVVDIPILDALGRDQTAAIVAEPAATYLLSRSNTDTGRRLNRLIHVDILPSIRKTGRYQVQAAPPEPAPDYLTNADLTNLSNLVHSITEAMRHEAAWRFSTWKALRRATGVPTGQRFEVRHLPILAAEVRRIFAATEAYKAAVAESQVELLRRVFRQGEDWEPIMADLRAGILAEGVERATQLNLLLEPWRMREVTHLLERTPPWAALGGQEMTAQRTGGAA